MRPFDEILLEGARSGQFGGELEPHGHHAMGFFAFSGPPVSDTVCAIDIGSGVGLPALVLAEAYPRSTWTLIERRQGRTELLQRAVHRLGFSERVSVLTSDVVAVAHSPLRASADVVTARSFGPPADTAECATTLLRIGGFLITSEPEDSDIEDRWPSLPLEQLGLQFVEEWRTDHGRYVRFVRLDVDLAHLPRKGARKRPLF